jgi:hypothetical protein
MINLFAAFLLNCSDLNILLQNLYSTKELDPSIKLEISNEVIKNSNPNCKLKEKFIVE